MQNCRLGRTVFDKPGNTHRLPGTSTCLAHQGAAGWVFGWFKDRATPFLWSKPGHLAIYPDPLLTQLLYQLSIIQVALKSGHKTLFRCNSLLKLTLLRLVSTSSNSLFEAACDYTTCCWYTPTIVHVRHVIFNSLSTFNLHFILQKYWGLWVLDRSWSAKRRSYIFPPRIFTSQVHYTFWNSIGRNTSW